LDPASTLKLHDGRCDRGPIDASITEAREPSKLVGPQPQTALLKNFNR
jgi:hypothetical protein